MRLRGTAVFALALAAIVPACSCDGAGSAADAGASDRPGACHSYFDCPVGQRCDDTAGVCVPQADAGAADAGPDGGRDAGGDAGLDGGDDAGAADGGDDGGSLDAGADAGPDAGFDAGPPLPPVRATGVNLHHIFFEYLKPGTTGYATARAAMDDARAKGFTHARFIAGGFWPTDFNTGKGWVTNPTAFWGAFDDLVADARARGLHLVPSLLWNLYTYGDLAGEPLGKLFTPGSTSRTLAERFVTETVNRYKNDPTILFWELGNEWNLSADIDVSACSVCGGATNACGSLAPTLGTPCSRSAQDDFFSCNACRGVSSPQQDLGEFAESLAALVKSLDPSRGVSSGFAYPRPAAHHLAASPCPACDWTADSPSEYASVLSQLHGPHLDVLSVHHYPGPDCLRFGDGDPAGVALLDRTSGLASVAGKTLYVGEWGEPRAAASVCGGVTTQCGGDDSRVLTRRSLDAFVADAVPYTAVWGFDFYACPGSPDCFGVVSGDDIVDSMAAHDAAYGACSGQVDGNPCPIGACSAGRCAPKPIGTLSLHSATDVVTWTSWTNCSACGPSSFTFVAGQPGYGHLATQDLPCTTGCNFPGGYALSPALAATPGHLVARFVARASDPGGTIRFLVSDAGGTELTATSAPAIAGTSFRTGSVWLTLPAATASIRVRAEMTTPYATVDVDSVVLEWEP